MRAEIDSLKKQVQVHTSNSTPSQLDKEKEGKFN